MAKCDPVYTAHQLRRWMAPNAHMFVRPDWRRHVAPGSELYAVFELYEQKYREDQLRDDHGRFAYEGRDKPSRVRVAASENGPLGPRSRALLALEAARTAFEAYRSAPGRRDLFGQNVGALSYTEIDTA